MPGAVAQVQFGPRHEVVQPLPVESVATARGASGRVAPARVTSIGVAAVARPARSAAPAAPVHAVAAAATAAPASGAWYVQVGAYQNAAVARDAWRRIRISNPALGAHQPQGASVTAAGATFYRLSVGGFSQDGAAQLCASYRQQGGRCFVRVAAGDRIASWSGAIRPTVALASR